jgi:alpha-galactosidase
MPPSIVILGAGSATFAASILRDLCLTPSLDGARVTLMDIDSAKLARSEQFLVRYAQETGRRFSVQTMTDRRRSLAGADFVVTTILVGGYRLMWDGYEIARRHGYRFGGSLHIMGGGESFWINSAQLAMMESVQRDIADVCPDAWHLLVANPVIAGVTLLCRTFAGARIVGLCHGCSGVYRLARTMGLDEQTVSFTVSGVNHFIWLTEFRAGEQDAYPLLDRWIERREREHWEGCELSDENGPKACDLYRRMGLYPVGDTASMAGGGWPHWYHTDETVEQRWREQPERWLERHYGWVAANVRLFERAVATAEPLTGSFPPVLSGEPIVPMMESLAGGASHRLVVNILNRERLVEYVPPDFEIEVHADVDARGIRPIPPHPLPQVIRSYLLRDKVATTELELEAYRRHSRDGLVQLVMTDPWTRSEAQAAALVDDILAMPGNEQIRRHYR